MMNKNKKSAAHAKKGRKAIVIIGHLVWDRIRNAGGGWRESLGGTAYSWAALGSQLDMQATAFPICRVGYDLYEKAREYFARFPNLDLSLMRKIARKNKVHELIYRESGCREETNFGEMPLIRPPAHGLPSHIDAALINYISGDEFPPRFIRRLKKEYASLVYLDYHSLALGKRKCGGRPGVRRYLRLNPHWKTYIASADIVQMNNYELQSIMPCLKLDTESVVRAAAEIHSLGPKAVIITREADDLVVIHGSTRKPRIEIMDVSPVENLIDPTGCGDSFAAGFIAEYIQTRDIMAAARRGLMLAARKATFSGIEGFFELLNKA